jgi:hypothetical protein
MSGRVWAEQEPNGAGSFDISSPQLSLGRTVSWLFIKLSMSILKADSILKALSETSELPSSEREALGSILPEAGT